MPPKRKRDKEIKFLTPVKKIKNDDKTYSIKKNYNSSGCKRKKVKAKNQKKIKNLDLSLTVKENPSIYESNGLNLNTIEELHKMALDKFNELKVANKIDYRTILDEVIKIYDIDENLNEIFLNELNNHYQRNKTKIDESTDGQSDSLSQIFFNYIFTLGFEKRKNIMEKFNYFEQNELFTEKDKKYFYPKSIENVFKDFIKEILKVSSTINVKSQKKSNEDYMKILSGIYENYSFPQSEFKIPVKFGNSELMYINFIVKFQSFLCVQKTDNFYNNKFFEYKLETKFLALNFFSDYFELNKYDIISIQYIICTLYCFFLYYDQDPTLIENMIQNKFNECSRFLFQKFEEKIKNIKEIKQYIKNDIDFQNITEDYLNKNLLMIEYNKKKIQINGNHSYFLGNNEKYLLDLISGNTYNFTFLKSKKFPLFLNENENNDFVSYIKTFLQSDITNEYINSLKDIPNSNSIIFTDKIIKEILDNTYWVKFPLNCSYGVSDRDTYSIFLNNKIDRNNSNQYSAILASKIITCGHEYENHFFRLLLFINGYSNSKFTPREEEIYKEKSLNDICLKYLDQGDIWEAIIFGEKITNIFIKGSLFILDSNNFNMKIKKFRELFNKNNRRESVKNLNGLIANLKKNEKNTLLKYINELTNDSWMENIQFIVGRNNSSSIFESFQCIKFGICATHGFDLYN